MNHATSRWCASCLAVVSIASVVRATEYSDIIAFGASLSDGGNVYAKSPEVLGFNFPVSPPNYMGRFSNGPSWLDNLAELLGLDQPVASEMGGNNYAWSGATTGAVPGLFSNLGIIDMDAQVAEFLREKTITGDELFVIPGWTSLNDFDSRHTEPAAPAQAAQYVGQIISDLASAGAKNFFIPLGMNSPRRNRPTATTSLYNAHLLDEINSAQQTHPDASITTFNAERTVDSFYSDPASIGVRFVEGSACNDCTLTNQNPVQIAENPNEYLFWEGNHFTAPASAALGRAAFERLTSPDLINEDFEYLPLSGLPHGTTFVDTNIGRSWGPGIITHVDDAIRFQTSGEVPPKNPVSKLETGTMVLAWDTPADDSSLFSDGYLRTTLRADTQTNATVALRGDMEQLNGYLFGGIGTRQRFEVHCFCDESPGKMGEIASPAFEVGVDYHIEVGAVGNRITMKVWPAGDEEPGLPQLVLFDERRIDGVVALAPAASPASLPQPTSVDVTYDQVSFRPSTLGDINQDSVVDVLDITQLTAAVAGGNQHPFFDLNRDGSVDQADRAIWIQEPEFANTYVGDANLDGEFNSTDLVNVFAAAKYELDDLADWSEGDWNGDARFDSSDLISAFRGDGFEQGPRSPIAVPEPEVVAWLIMVAALFPRRRLKTSQ